MQDECKFAGFGGQGIMTVGRLLALAGLQAEREVIWIPSYGPEMRGGTAYCTVVISGLPIGSPIINTPGSLVAMNRPSLEKFAPTVRPGGVIIINSSLIPVSVPRDDVDVLEVPCNQIALEIGSVRSASMVALGALAARSAIVPFETLCEVIESEFKRKAEVARMNLAALERGAEVAREKPRFEPPAADA